MKKSESDDKSEEIIGNRDLRTLWNTIERLQMRVKELEGELEALQRGDNTGEKHKNDGGWFD